MVASPWNLASAVGSCVTCVVISLLEAAVEYGGVANVMKHVRSTRGTMRRDMSGATINGEPRRGHNDKHELRRRIQKYRMMSCDAGYDSTMTRSDGQHKVPKLRRAATVVIRWKSVQNLYGRNEIENQGRQHSNNRSVNVQVDCRETKLPFKHDVIVLREPRGVKS